jgi:hypothetical protein
VRLLITIRETCSIYINRKLHPANAKIGEWPGETGKRALLSESIAIGSGEAERKEHCLGWSDSDTAKKRPGGKTVPAGSHAIQAFRT